MSALEWVKEDVFAAVAAFKFSLFDIDRLDHLIFNGKQAPFPNTVCENAPFIRIWSIVVLETL